MNYLLHKARLQHLISHRNGYLALASGSLILNVLLAIAIFIVSGHERIVLVPPDITKTFWVSKSHVSQEYLSEMTLFFADLRFNLTANNIAMQHDLLLRYVNPNGYADVKAQLLNEADKLTKEHVSMAFFPVDIKVDATSLTSVVTGDIQGSVGNTLLPLERVKYQLRFIYHDGRLLVKSFDEVKPHA